MRREIPLSRSKSKTFPFQSSLCTGLFRFLKLKNAITDYSQCQLSHNICLLRDWSLFPQSLSAWLTTAQKAWYVKLMIITNHYDYDTTKFKYILTLVNGIFEGLAEWTNPKMADKRRVYMKFKIFYIWLFKNKLNFLPRKWWNAF